MSSSASPSPAGLPPLSNPSNGEDLKPVVASDRPAEDTEVPEMKESEDEVDTSDSQRQSCKAKKILAYSSQELRAMAESLAAKKWPNFLDEAFKNARGQWDPDRWHQNRKRGSTPTITDVGKGQRSPTSLSTEGGMKPRKDAKDRIKAEQQDGIVLSPQRRSFLGGCHVSSVKNSESNGKDCKENSSNHQNQQHHPHEEGLLHGQGKRVVDRGSARNFEREDYRDVRDRDRAQGRRIGSGRILTRAGEPGADEYDLTHRRHDSRFGFRRGEEEPLYDRRDRSRDRKDRWSGGGGRYEADDGFGGRRNNHYQVSSMRGGGNGGGRSASDRRFGNTRYPRRSEEAEPEWMSETVEQGELMELRGFDDSPEQETIRNDRPLGSDENEKSNSRQNAVVDGHEDKPAQGQKQASEFNLEEFLQMDSIPGLANILSDDSSKEAEANQLPPQSRFSKFFSRPMEEANDWMASKPNTTAEDAGMKIRIPSPPVANEGSSFYFAPISPAAKTSSHSPNAAKNESSALMELLKVNNNNNNNSSVEPTSLRQAPALRQMPEKATSLEELEASLRQMTGLGVDARPQERQVSALAEDNSSTDELSAFKKFAAMLEGSSHSKGIPHNMKFAQMTDSVNRPLRPPQVHHGVVRPAPLPANAPTEQDILISRHHQPNAQPHPHASQMRRASMMPPAILPPPHPHQVPNMHGGLRLPVQGPPHLDLLQLIHQAPFNVEILQRQEAHVLQQALERGDATPLSLLHQFAHGNLPGLHREILLNVLKVQQNQGRLPTRIPSQPQQHYLGVMPNMSPRGSPHQSENFPLNSLIARHQQQQQQHPHHHPQHQHPQRPPHQKQQQPQPQQQQPSQVQQQPNPALMKSANNLAVSPTSGQQRIPSPQELVYHTQQIMQNALIRRKLEEQKENYRKRTEACNEAVKGPGGSSPTAASPLLSFTPTVVMKKLAADRRDSDPKPQIPELRINQGDAGHSAGKANVSDESNSQGLMGAMPHVPLPPPNPIFMMQQQPHQHSHMGSVPVMRPTGEGPMSPQSQNQQRGDLSQFFSPEVIAQVQSGNAPHMPPLPTQKALTLEELERQSASVAL